MWTGLANLFSCKSNRDAGFGKKLNIRWSLKQPAWGGPGDIQRSPDCQSGMWDAAPSLSSLQGMGTRKALLEICTLRDAERQRRVDNVGFCHACGKEMQEGR